jgi:glycosyltransferase involved in cell wall biosynthesis
MEEKDNIMFHILFWGNFIPLQGVEYIIRAAKILENDKNIIFTLIGSGQTFNQVKKEADNLKIRNVRFLCKLPVGELPPFISKADVCLGIFGDTDKAQRVIPNKVYEAIAMAKPVITGDTPAIRELFADRENILLCQTANPNDLAEKILELKDSDTLRNRIARGGYEIFQEYAIPKVIAQKFIAELKIL